MFMRFTFSLCYSRLWFDDLIVRWCLWWIVVTGILYATRSSGFFFFFSLRVSDFCFLLYVSYSSRRFFWKLITIRSSILNFRLLLVYFSFCCCRLWMMLWSIGDCFSGFLSRVFSTIRLQANFDPILVLASEFSHFTDYLFF